ncbi:MAG: hypothetical protein DPW09_33090 [Anaerolineae bacterium]|nr:hypothetical protein [Anaerolineae bacterium]
MVEPFVQLQGLTSAWRRSILIFMRILRPIEFLAWVGEVVRVKDEQDRRYRDIFSLIIGGIAFIILIWSLFN